MSTQISNVYCLQCHVEFQVRTAEIQRGNGKFCSRKCAMIHRNTQTKLSIVRTPNLTCAFCHKAFYRPISKQNSKSGLYFCCRRCKDLAQRIEGIAAIHPSHYGNGVNQDYRTKALRLLPSVCAMCGYDDYPQILEVHHIDLDHSNHTLSNLQILCPNCHAVVHLATPRT